MILILLVIAFAQQLLFMGSRADSGPIRENRAISSFQFYQWYNKPQLAEPTECPEPLAVARVMEILAMAFL